MKLAEFLFLNQDEKTHQKTILKFILENTDISEDTVKFITEMDEGILLKLAIIDNEIDQFLQAHDFQVFWDGLWRQCGASLSELILDTNAVQEYVPLVTISSLELLKGFYIYQAYLGLIKNETMTPELFSTVLDYLKLSANLGCFFALNVLCIEGLALLKTNPNAALANEILAYAKSAADLYWTPGYLLLANVYQELSLYSSLMFPKGQDEQVNKKYFFQQASIALTMAQLLEDHSQPMINNAYQGKTLWQASDEQLKSWVHAKMRLEHLSNGLLKTLEFDKALSEAKQKVSQIKRNFSHVFVSDNKVVPINRKAVF